jgi:hypothetical protein
LNTISAVWCAERFRNVQSNGDIAGSYKGHFETKADAVKTRYMPLIKGYSNASIQANIRKLVSEGYSQQQAIAIAYDIAEEARKKRKTS